MMTSFMTSSGSIEVARGNLPEEHLFKLEEAKLLSVLGMPASSLAPKQLSRGSDLSRGIMRNSKLLTPVRGSVALPAVLHPNSCHGDQICHQESFVTPSF